MRQLTKKEKIKLREFKKIFEGYIRKKKKNLFGRLSVFLSEADYKLDMVCGAIELFLTHNIEDLKGKKNE